MKSLVRRFNKSKGGKNEASNEGPASNVPPGDSRSPPESTLRDEAPAMPRASSKYSSWRSKSSKGSISRSAAGLISPQRLRREAVAVPAEPEYSPPHSVASSLSAPDEGGRYDDPHTPADRSLHATNNPAYALSPPTYAASHNGSTMGLQSPYQPANYRRSHDFRSTSAYAGSGGYRPGRAHLQQEEHNRAERQAFQQAAAQHAQAVQQHVQQQQHEHQRLYEAAPTVPRSQYEQTSLRRSRTQAMAAAAVSEVSRGQDPGYTVTNQLLADDELRTLRALYRQAAAEGRMPSDAAVLPSHSDGDEGRSRHMERSQSAAYLRDLHGSTLAQHRSPSLRQAPYAQAPPVARRPSADERERVAAVHRDQVIADYLATVDHSPEKPLGRAVSQPAGLLRNGGYQVLNPEEMSQIESWAAQTRRPREGLPPRTQSSSPAVSGTYESETSPINSREYGASSSSRRSVDMMPVRNRVSVDMMPVGSRISVDRTPLARDVNDFGQHPMLAYDGMLAGQQGPQGPWLEHEQVQHRVRDPSLPRQGSTGVDRQSSLGSQRSVGVAASSLYAVADQHPQQHRGLERQGSSGAYASADQYPQQLHGVERQGSSSSYAASIPDRSTLPPVSRQSSGKSAYMAAEPYLQDAQRGVSRQGSGKSSYLAVEPNGHHAQHTVERQSSFRSYDARSQHSAVLEQDDLAAVGSGAPLQHSHSGLDSLAYHAGNAHEYPQRTDSGSQGEDAVKGRMVARFEQAVRAAEQLEGSRASDGHPMGGREVAPPETPEQPSDPRLKIGTPGSLEASLEGIDASTPNQASRATAWFHRMLTAQAQAQARDGGPRHSRSRSHAAELAEINADMQSALHAAESQIDFLRLRLRSQRFGIAGSAASQSAASIADSDDQQADRDVGALRGVIERMQAEMAAMEEELAAVREERAVGELEGLAAADEAATLAASLKAAEAANAQLTAQLQQVDTELAQKKALIRTDSSTRAMGELEDTIELLRGELDELRQANSGSGTLAGTRSRSMGSANRDADMEDLAADLAQAGVDKRQLEAELQRTQRAAVEQNEAMQLLQGELEVAREQGLVLREALERLEAENRALGEAHLRSGGGSGNMADAVGSTALARSSSRDASLALRLSEVARKNAELSEDLNKALDMAEKKMNENAALQERCAQAEKAAEEAAAAAQASLAEEQEASVEASSRLAAEVTLLSAQVERMTGEVSQAEGLAEEAMNLYEQERAVTSQLRAELQTLQGQVAEAQANTERLQAAAAQAEATQQRSAKLAEQLEAKEAQVSTLQADIQEKDAVIGDLDALQQRLGQLEDAQTMAERLRSERDAAAAAAAAVEAQVLDLERQLRAMEASAPDGRAVATAGASAAVLAAEAAAAAAQKELQEAQRDLQQAQGEVRRLQAELDASLAAGEAAAASTSALQEAERKLADAQRELQQVQASHAAAVLELHSEVDERIAALEAGHAAQLAELQARLDDQQRPRGAEPDDSSVTRAEAEALVEAARAVHAAELHELQRRAAEQVQSLEAAHLAEVQRCSELEAELSKAQVSHMAELARLQAELDSQLHRSVDGQATPPQQPRSRHSQAILRQGSHPSSHGLTPYDSQNMDTLDLLLEPSSPQHTPLSTQDLVTAALSSQELANLMSQPRDMQASADSVHTGGNAHADILASNRDDMNAQAGTQQGDAKPDRAADVHALRAETLQLRQQVGELQGRVQALLEDQPESRSTAKLVAEVARLKGQLAANSKAASEAASLRADLEGVNVQMAGKNAEVVALRGQVKLLEAQVEDTRRAVEVCSSKVVGAQQRMFEETEKLDALSQEHAMLKMKYAELQSDYEAALANRRRQ